MPAVGGESRPKSCCKSVTVGFIADADDEKDEDEDDETGS
jgi:hypothetical protein